MAGRLLLLFNHRLTAAQEAAAQKELGVGEVVPLPAELQTRWSQIPPELPGLRDYLAPFRRWLSTAAQRGDFVLIQGDFGATYLMVRFALRLGLIPVYATTRREAGEEHHADGVVKLVHHFRHEKFRRYGR